MRTSTYRANVDEIRRLGVFVGHFTLFPQVMDGNIQFLLVDIEPSTRPILPILATVQNHISIVQLPKDISLLAASVTFVKKCF